MRERKPLFNLPNSLTLSRFILAPAMLWLVMRMDNPENDPRAWIVSLAVFCLLMMTLLTDLFDGAVARARREVTNFGKIMDPVADSTFFMTLLFGLSACPRFGEWVSIWFPVLVLYREVGIQILRRYAALKGHAVPAKMSGKIKMFTQSLAIAVFFFMVLIRDWQYAFMPDSVMIGEDFLQCFAFYSAVFTVAVNYLSLIEYSRGVPELMAEYTSGHDGGDAPRHSRADVPGSESNGKA